MSTSSTPDLAHVLTEALAGELVPVFAELVRPLGRAWHLPVDTPAAAATELLESEEEPAASWYGKLSKRKNKPTMESLLKLGRQVVKDCLRDIARLDESHGWPAPMPAGTPTPGPDPPRRSDMTATIHDRIAETELGPESPPAPCQGGRMSDTSTLVARQAAVSTRRRGEVVKLELALQQNLALSKTLADLAGDATAEAARLASLLDQERKR